MNLASTKAMEQPYTKQRLNSLDLARNIELPLKEFASLYTSNLNSHIKGLWCENLVAIYLNSKKWRLLSHRKKIKSIEIDLIFRTPKNQIVLIEVKSMNSMQKAIPRWSHGQQRKFTYVMEQLNVSLKHEEIYGLLALVEYNRLSFFYLDET